MLYIPSVWNVCRHCRRLDDESCCSLWNGSVQAEERRNWLKAPSRPAATAYPKPRAVSVSSFPEASYRYRLGPGDKLVMSVFKIEGYEASVQVLSDGTINLPRLGTMDVWGLTMDDARQRITDGYSQILRRPIVYLDLVEQRPVRVTVTGHVGRPGVFHAPCEQPREHCPAMESWGVVVVGPPWWM